MTALAHEGKLLNLVGISNAMTAGNKPTDSTKLKKIKHLSIQGTCNIKPLEEGEKGINELVINVELCWRHQNRLPWPFLGAKNEICT